jgi:hypothetical protein
MCDLACLIQMLLRLALALLMVLKIVMVQLSAI